MPPDIPYRSMFEDNPHPMWMYDLETLAFLAVNNAAVHLYGYTREEFLAMTIKDIRPAEDVPALLEAVASVGGGFTPPQGWRHRKKNGTVIQVEITSHTIDFSGRPAELVLARDITARRQAEARVRHLNRVYAVLSDINQAIVREKDTSTLLVNACRIAVDKGGFLMAWIGVTGPRSGRLSIAAHAGADAGTVAVLQSLIESDPPAGCVFTQRTLETAAFQVCNQIDLDPEAAGWRAAALARGYRSMASFPLRTGTDTTGVFNLYAAEPDFFTHDEVALLDELAQDISFALEVARRDTELELERNVRLQAEERFRELAETIEDVFWIADAQKSRMLYVSPAFERIWGQPCQVLYDAPMSWAESIHPDDRPRVTQAAATEQTTGAYDEEYRIVRPDGVVRWIRDQAFPVRDAGGQVLRVVGVARDITERRDLEKQFRQAQKMEAVGQLASGVAHDFNNILTAIQFNAALLQATDGLPAEATQCARDIEEAVHRAAGLTRQLLTFSRKQVMQARHLDLNTVVTELSSMLRRIIGEDVVLDVRCTTEALPVHADPGMVEQVLMNLALNARDAMPAGGTVVVETTTAVVQGMPHARLSVTDTGTGMTPEVQARVFEPFFTTKAAGRGTGLGLAMVHGIVEQHRGRIEVDTVVGRGTTFMVYIPCLPTASVDTRVTAVEPLQASHTGGQTILVAEDEANVRQLIRTILTRAGYRVLVAEHGVAALALWAAHKDTIDLVLTDIVMPEGMTGVDLARAIRLDSLSCPIVFTSGYAPEAVTQQVTLTEDVNFLPKPLSVTRLLRVVAQVLSPAPR